MGIGHHVYREKRETVLFKLNNRCLFKENSWLQCVDNLNTESSLVALKLAVKQRVNKGTPLIHHSDRGLQYCANEYQNELNKHKINPRTQSSDPYENAVAERINGILKQAKTYQL